MNKKIYKAARKAAITRRKMRAAKDSWFQRKALEAERGRQGGKLVCGDVSVTFREERGS